MRGKERKVNPMGARLGHIVLAMLILINTVSALAVVSVQPVDTGSQAPSHAMMSDCHDEAPSLPIAPNSPCCETMDDASCLLSCSTAVTALSLEVASFSTITHETFVLEGGHVNPRSAASELFRPPRII